MKPRVVHATAYEFPLDRCFYGQTFVIADHVRNSTLETAVSSGSKHNLEDAKTADLQRRVAKEKFRTDLVFKPGKIHGTDDDGQGFENTEYGNMLERWCSEGNVALAVHFLKSGIGQFDSIKKRFKDKVSFNLHLHCLADLYFGNLNTPQLTDRQKQERRRLHDLIDRVNPQFIAVSDAVRDSFHRHGLIPEGTIQVVRNGVSSDLYSKASEDQKDQFRRDLGINASHLVGYTGRIEPVKGSKALFSILEHYEGRRDDVGFVIATANGFTLQDFAKAAQARLPKLVKSGRLKLCLDVSKLTAGFYTKDSDVCEHIRRLPATRYLASTGLFSDIITRPLQPHLDVYLQPSMSEGLPLSVLEAAMSEVPVVASNVGGIPEVVNYNTGRLIEVRGRPSDDYVGEFVEAINGFIKNPVRPDYSAQTRTNLIGTGFDAKTMARRFDELYTQHS